MACRRTSRGFDLAKVVARSRGVAKQLNQGVTHLMKKNKITVHMGEGKLTAPGKMTVTAEGKTTELAAKHIIIATGARARELPFAQADGKRIWTYRHAMTPPEMPTKLLVIGSGAIGIEFASFYNDLGAEVTVVEMLDRIVPVEDADVCAFLEKSLAKQGMTMLTGAGVESLKADAKGVAAKIKAKDGKVAEQRFSHAIVAVGIAPNTENIGLEKLGVKTTKGHIETDAMAAPTCPASGRSATSPRRPGWRTRRATRGSSRPRRSPRSSATRTSTRTRWTSATFPAAPIATRRSPASA